MAEQPEGMSTSPGMSHPLPFPPPPCISSLFLHKHIACFSLSSGSLRNTCLFRFLWSFCCFIKKEKKRNSSNVNYFLKHQMKKRTSSWTILWIFWGSHLCDSFLSEWGESRGKGQHFWPAPAVEGWTIITALRSRLKSQLLYHVKKVLLE